MVDLVLLVGDTGRDETPLVVGVVGGQDPGLRRREAVDGEDQVGAAPGAAHAQVEGEVRLLVDEVVGRVAERVTVEPVLALGGFLLDRVEERPVVGRPDRRAHPLGNRLPDLTRLEVLHEQRVLSKPGGVGGVGEEPAVVGDLVHPEGYERLAHCQLVEIEGDLLRRVAPIPAATVDCVLPALDRPRVVEPPPPPVGDVLVRLLDAGQHLVVEPFPQRAERRQDRVRVGVLGLEMGPDLGVRLLAKPGVLVDTSVAVDLADRRECLRDRGSGRVCDRPKVGGRHAH